jgi:branched-subunit amino acid ABC-type transport system permease component
MTATLAGSFLGGVRSIRYALVGGFTVGLVEFLFTVFGQAYIGVWVGEYRPFIPILILALVMYLAPDGVLSKIFTTEYNVARINDN